MHCAHIHNRLNVHITDVIRSCHEITYLMALPIPFPYFHVLNFIMVMNFLILAFAFATFKTYYAVVPFGFATLIYMGLREVSTALADPFGVDQFDFPIADFMDYAFDHSISILEAFSAPQAYQRVMSQVSETTPFNDDQMLRPAHTKLMYASNKNNRTEQFSWGRPAPLRQTQSDEQPLGPTQLLRTILLEPEAAEGVSKPVAIADQAPDPNRQEGEDVEDAAHYSVEHERGVVASLNAEVLRKEARIIVLRTQLESLGREQATAVEELTAAPASSPRQAITPAQAATGRYAENDEVVGSASSDEETLVSPAVQRARQRLRGSETFDEARLRIRQILEDTTTAPRQQADGSAEPSACSSVGSSSVHRRRTPRTDKT